MCVSPQLLFDAMSLVIHHDVADALARVGRRHSRAERRDLAVVCCIDRLRQVLRDQKASPEMFQLLEHGYMEAGWLQQLWPQPERSVSREGALHLLRMLSQAQLCYPLDDSLERFQFPALLPEDDAISVTRLQRMCPSARTGIAGAVGARLTRLEGNIPASNLKSLDTVEGCAALLQEALGNTEDASVAAQAIFDQLDSVLQFVVLSDYEILTRLEATQTAVEHENRVCDAVAQLQRRVLLHIAAQPDRPPVPACVFPPDFIHHLQIQVVRRAIALERLQQVTLWRDGVMFPVNLISSLGFLPEVVVQVQMLDGALVVLILCFAGGSATAAVSFEHALPVVLAELVRPVCESGNFVDLRWDRQLFNNRHLAHALQRMYEGCQDTVSVGLKNSQRIRTVAPSTPLPAVPVSSPPADLEPVPPTRLLQRCGLGLLCSLIPEPQSCDVDSFMEQWEDFESEVDVSFLLMGLDIYDEVDEQLQEFLQDRLALTFVRSMLDLCGRPRHPHQGQLDLDAALAMCGLKPLRRVFVEVLGWDTVDLCQGALVLLRQLVREARSTAGVHGSTHGRPPTWELWINLLSLNDTERAMFLKLLRPDTTLAVLINAVVAHNSQDASVQSDVEALCDALDVNEQVFPAGTTHRLPVCQALRSDDVATVCQAANLFFRPKLALVWLGVHGSDEHRSELSFQHDHMAAEQLRQHLQALNATTTLLFLHSCFSQDLIHANLVFEGLMAFAFAAKGQLVTPGISKAVLSKVLSAGHVCGGNDCEGCKSLRRACEPTRIVTVAALIDYLQFHRSKLLATSEPRPTNVVASLPHFSLPVFPFVDRI